MLTCQKHTPKPRGATYNKRTKRENFDRERRRLPVILRRELAAAPEFDVGGFLLSWRPVSASCEGGEWLILASHDGNSFTHYL